MGTKKTKSGTSFRCICEEKPGNDDIRNRFQHDRDRILYSKAFRRLAGKTQVFVAAEDDHIRTRLTHTLEVAQIAKTLSHHLGLDCDLTEAIAYGHDIGHAPFGHAGERVINLMTNGCEPYKGFNLRSGDDSLLDSFKGFKHNWQAVYILEYLTKYKGDYGCKISMKTLFGILMHTKLEYSACDSNNANICTLRSRNDDSKCLTKKFSMGYYTSRYDKVKCIDNFSFEAMIVSISDEIAQRHHDIEDGLRYEIMDLKTLRSRLSKVLSERDMAIFIKHLDSNIRLSDLEGFLTLISSVIVNTYINKVIDHFNTFFQSLKRSKITSLRGFIKDAKKNGKIVELIFKQNDIDVIIPKDKELKSYLYSNILRHHQTQLMDGRAYFMIVRMFKAFLSNPQQLPDKTIMSLYRHAKNYAKESKDSIIDSTFLNSLAKQKMTIDALREKLEKDHNKADKYYKWFLLRTVANLISGMTDHRALEEFQRLYAITPNRWWKLTS